MKLRRRTAIAGAIGLAGAPARADEAVSIAIQYGIGYLPVTIADKLDLFSARAAGAKLAISRLSGATAVNDALISGRIDVGAYGLPGMLIARERTVRSYGIAGLCALNALPYRLYTNNPAITTIADIAPSDRIAVTAPNTPQAELLRMAAQRTWGDAHKLDTQMVSLPHPEATVALMTGHSITMYFAVHPFSSVLDKAPGIHLVTTSTDILPSGMTGGMLATTKRFVDRGGLAAALVTALAEADRLIATDPARMATIYLDSEPSKLSHAETEALLRDIGSYFGVAPSGTSVMAAFMAAQGELKTPLARWQEAFFPPVNEGSGS